MWWPYLLDTRSNNKRLFSEYEDRSTVEIWDWLQDYERSYALLLHERDSFIETILFASRQSNNNDKILLHAFSFGLFLWSSESKTMNFPPHNFYNRFDELIDDNIAVNCRPFPFRSLLSQQHLPFPAPCLQLKNV